MYIEVAKLFLNDADLLREFKQFLPDASGNGGFGFNVTSNTSTPVHSVSFVYFFYFKIIFIKLGYLVV